MYKKGKTQNGITLIALVITIIVMLILVAVTISMAVNGGLFDYAGKAVSETNNAIKAEGELADGGIEVDGTYYNSIDEYLKGDTGKVTGTYASTEKDANGMLTANATYTSGEYTAVIPKGFAIVPGLNGTTTIADGLVITDELDAEGNSIGNEFVWIPVEVTDTDTATSIASFYRSSWSNNARSTSLMDSTIYTEPYESGYTEEVAEYNEMLKSVYENGGFYIGRYEAGSTTARTDTANGTTEMVVKRDAYPYNYVGWGESMTDYTSDVIYIDKNQGLGALALSKAMYANKDVGVTSTLCYGIQWDAMLDFIKDDTHNVTNSTTWGNYKDTVWTITRTSAKYYDDINAVWIDVPEEGLAQKEPTKVEESDYSYTVYDSKLLTTGASDNFAAKNIYDVAGNVCERTNEVESTDMIRPR